MSSLGNALVSTVLGHSAAEMAFRPWWDNLRDFLVYGLVMLGLIVAPTAIINATPLDCTPCINKHCAHHFDNASSDEGGSVDELPNFNAWWVKKYCTMTAVDRFMLYFPYILLVMALVLVLIERVTLRIFRSGLKLDTFYRLLVKENVQVDKVHGVNNKADDVDGDRVVDAALQDDVESARAAIEVSYSFSDGSRYFATYIVRTLSEMTVNVALLTWLLTQGLPSISTEQFIYCDVYSYHYECAGHPQQFYMYVLFLVVALLAAHLLCCSYSLLWVFFPRISALGRVMKRYEGKMRRESPDLSRCLLLGKLESMYYSNKDLRILLNLLAESSGVALAIRILAMFDPEFRARLEPINLQVSRENDEHVIVAFEEPSSLWQLFGSKLHRRWPCVCIVEILPPIKSGSIHAFRYGHPTEKPAVRELPSDGDTSGQPAVELRPLSPSKGGVEVRREVHFEHLKDIEYTIRVSTLINGRTIAYRWEAVPKLQVQSSQATRRHTSD